MSYDMWLTDSKTKKTIYSDKKHQVRGGTYAMGGTQELCHNITYNYSGYFVKHFGEEGIRFIYGKTPKEVESQLLAAIEKLGTKPDEDYWARTPGNAGSALQGLLTIGAMAPHGIWQGD